MQLPNIAIMAVNFGVNAQYDWQNNVISLPLQDAFNQSFGVLGTINGPNHEYGIDKVQGLAFALARLDVAMPDQLENHFVGMHGLTCAEAFSIITQSVNAGFQHSVVLGVGTRTAAFHNLLREAFAWAQNNIDHLRIIRPGSVYQLPALQGGGNPVRCRMAYPLLSDDTNGLLWAVAELIGLCGIIHDSASRGPASRFGLMFDTIVDALDTPPIADQPVRVARAIVLSGVPCFLRFYPEGMAQRYPAIQLRLFYLGGTFVQRREAFATSLPLLLKHLTTLRSFLVPAIDISQQVEAYRQMVEHIHHASQPPQENTWFTFEVAEALDQKLEDFPQVIVDAQAAAPPHGAAWRSQRAIAEHVRREAIVNNASAAGGVPLAGSTTAVAVSRALKQQLCNTLMTMPFFGPAQADMVRLHAGNPQNDLPIFQRAVATRNVFVLQVMIGKVRGVADAAPLFSILEGLQPSFSRYVTHVVVMDKAPSLTAGARQPHTLSYNFSDADLTAILSNERAKFVDGMDWLKLAADIKSAREHIPPVELLRGSNIFESAENIPLLRYLQHFLDVFDYTATGPGSLGVGLDRLEQFRQTGNALPAGARADHLNNCLAAWKVLLGDWFDSMSNFCGSREAPQVGLLLSNFIYEVGGSFDLHLAYQSTQTQTLNSMLMLHPAFGRVLGASAPAAVGSSTSLSAGASGTKPGSGTLSPKQGPKVHRANGKIHFGKGTSGPTYVVAPILAELRKVKDVNQGNFCIEFYLSTQGYCSQSKHHPNCPQHKWPAAITSLRDSFEHRPFRVDSKALPEK